LTYILIIMMATLTLGFNARDALAQDSRLTDDPPEAGMITTKNRLRPATVSTNTEIEANSHTLATIVPGEIQQSRIDFPSDSDWFRARLNAGKRYQFDLISGGPGGAALSDPTLQLFNENSIAIASDDDGGSGKNSRILYQANSDQTVFLGAGGYSDNVGSYTLRLTELAEPEPLAVGASASGVITMDRPAVQYAVDLDADQSYIFTMVGQNGGGGTLADPLLRLLNPDLSKVAENDDSEGSRDSRMFYRTDTAGTFLLEAAAIGDNTGSYTVTANLYETPENEVGDTPESAGTLSADAPVRGRIDIPGDKDWFAADLVAGRTYIFRLNGAPTGEGTLGDTYLQLLNEGGQEIAANDDYEESTNSRISITASDSGRYFVVAGGLGERTGTYTLTMEGEGAEVRADAVRLVVELVDGQRIVLRLDRTFLSEINTIWIGPDMVAEPAQGE